jgi:hypothetical protein
VNHIWVLLGQYQKTRLTLQEVAHLLNISYGTARNGRSDGTFPIPMAGEPLTASVDDVGAYLQRIDEEAKRAPPAEGAST